MNGGPGNKFEGSIHHGDQRELTRATDAERAVRSAAVQHSSAVDGSDGSSRMYTRRVAANARSKFRVEEKNDETARREEY